MLKNPIFILELQRGGTNQFLNIIRSHPDTVWPDGELHEIFRHRGRKLREAGALITKAIRYAPLALSVGDVLNPRNHPRDGVLAGWRGRWFDAALATAVTANRGAVAEYKAALVDHGFIDPDKPSDERVVVKLVNGNVGLVNELARLYPSARFVGVLRDATAVCGGRLARGGSLDAAIADYSYVGSVFIKADEEGLSLKVFRFEDLLRDPIRVIDEIFQFCQLNARDVHSICLQDKGRVENGSGRVTGLTKSDGFYSLEGVARHMRQDANKASSANVTHEQKSRIEAFCSSTLSRYGYLPS